MGRQFRTQRIIGPGGGGNGHYREFVGPTPTSVATADMIPGYGVTDISTWAASTYYMAAPEQGAIKTLFSHSSNPAARTVRLSTAGTVTINWPGKTSGSAGNTELSFAASTLDTCLTLMGANSTHWLIVSIHPVLNSTGTSITST